MAETTFEKVLADALALPPEQQRRLVETLTGSGEIRPLKSLEQLMIEQGTRPLKFEELRPAVDIAPEESADEMVRLIYEQRRSDTHRSIE